MRNFDDQRSTVDREFTIGGEAFKIRRVRPETLFKYQDMGDDEARTIERLDEFFADTIVSGDVDRWRKLREREDDALTLGDVMAVMQWILAQQTTELAEVTGRPTMPPLPYTGGPGPTGMPLTAVSSSPDSAAASRR